MPSSHRHATDRWDWTFLAECPNNEAGEDGEHLTIEASAKNAKFRAEEAIPIEYCPLCGVELDLVVQNEPTEVLR